jgi:SAM-dependent methyltransferase
MAAQNQSRQQYVLGSAAEELARLDRQAIAIENPTRLLLQAAGIRPGMRVLDLGTGLGHVARLAGEFVGPTGAVVGIDQSEEVLTIARERTRAAGASHVTFMRADAAVWSAAEPFDAVIGRLLLFHVADPAAVVRRQFTHLRPGGLFVAVDFDIGASRTEPAVPLVDAAIRWVHDGFRAAGAWPRIGARLGTILAEAGLTRTATFGVQPYVSPGDPAGPLLLAGVVRSMAPAIVRHGIATDDQLGLATLEKRLREALQEADAVVLLPTVVGAWGHVPDAPAPS